MISKRSPLKAIRAKCLDCSGGQVKEVRLCPIATCPLYSFRMGRKFSTDAAQGVRSQVDRPT